MISGKLVNCIAGGGALVAGNATGKLVGCVAAGALVDSGMIGALVY